MNKKQVLIIVFIVFYFVLLNIVIFNVFTRRVINIYGKDVAEKSISLEKYLPFKDNSEIYKLENSSLKINENIPRIDGATALYPVYSSFVNSVYPKESVDFNGKDFTEKSYVQKTGTTEAFRRLADKETDIVICAGPSDKQIEYAKSKGVEFEMVPIGYEAFVFIVNKDNKVDSLTVEQIRNIYKGEYKNWNELGGSNVRLIPIQRAEGSGSQTAMIKFMGGEIAEREKNIFFGRGIGYSFRYYVESIVKDSNIKMISVEGIYPSEENIRNNTYPIVDNFYAIYRKDTPNENVKKFVDWMVSSEGQEIVNNSGYVGIK